jgi:exosome complex exonuclease RRP6
VPVLNVCLAKYSATVGCSILFTVLKSFLPCHSVYIFSWRKYHCFVIRILFIAVQSQGGSNVGNFNTVLPLQQFSVGMMHSANTVPTESLYPIPRMYGDDFWIRSTQMGEMMQLGDTAYYPQLAGYSTEVQSYYEPESMQMPGYLSGFEPGFESIDQRGTGTGQPPGSIKETSFQNSMKQQSFPPSSNRYNSTYR